MATKLIQSSGKLTFLRVHDVGSKFGPQSDQIDVEVVIKINSHSDRAMGFQLRNDKNQAAHQGMLDLLRDALNYDSKVTIDYSIDLDAGKKNGVILRVALEK